MGEEAIVMWKSSRLNHEKTGQVRGCYRQLGSAWVPPPGGEGGTLTKFAETLSFHMVYNVLLYSEG